MSNDLPPLPAGSSPEDAGANRFSEPVADDRPHFSHRDAEITADARLYIPQSEGWAAHIKQNSDKLYCHTKNPEEDYFHLIVSGELYLQCDTEVICLSCALRRDILTRDRLFWQHQKLATREKPPPG